MTKLQQLRTIRDQLMKSQGWSTDEATIQIGELLGRSRFTVYRWFNESQKDPIPDNLLELLSLKIKPDHRAKSI